jgi:hypothetical protein
MIYSTTGDRPTMICGSCAGAGAPYAPPRVSWSPDQRFLNLALRSGTYAIPIPAGHGVPPRLLGSTASSETDAASWPGARRVGGVGIFAGPTPEVHAFTRVVVQRNIYRVPVP